MKVDVKCELKSWKGDVYSNKLRGALKSSITSETNSFARVIRASMTRGKSAPYSPPGVRTGAYRDSIKSEVTEAPWGVSGIVYADALAPSGTGNQSVIGKRGFWLEYGVPSNNMAPRPHFGPMWLISYLDILRKITSKLSSIRV